MLSLPGSDTTTYCPNCTKIATASLGREKPKITIVLLVFNSLETNGRTRQEPIRLYGSPGCPAASGLVRKLFLIVAVGLPKPEPVCCG
jgi:hypothetical protein